MGDVAAVASAETVVLRNRSVITGKLQSIDAQEVGIERCGRVERFAREEVKSISLESYGSGEPCDGASQPRLELPEGYGLTVRTIDHIDSQHEPLGQVFRAVLESSLEVDGRVLVSAGAPPNTHLKFLLRQAVCLAARLGRPKIAAQ